ncbi:calcium-binding protein [Actinoplanes hulinensis]|nr:hypothetical protein [Actinoplanes hulinensis]
MTFSIKSVGIVAAGIAAIASAAVLPAPAYAASAGTAFIADYTVEFTAAKGAVNDVVIIVNGKTVTIDDRVAIKPGPGCRAVPGDSTKVRCTDDHLFWIFAKLGDRNDRIVNRSAIDIMVLGGAGDDRIAGGSTADSLYGGSGRDVLSGGAGPDSLIGGTGDDVLGGGAGNDNLNADAGRDVMRGGSGIDLAYYGGRRGAVRVDLDGAKGDDGAPGEGDTVGADVEMIVGGSGNDRLTGNGAANRIYGGTGDDRISGGGGKDLLVGQGGNDTLRGDAGSDRLYGEQEHARVPDADGTPASNPKAKDHLNGGTATDTCVGGSATTKVNCEIRRES